MDRQSCMVSRITWFITILFTMKKNFHGKANLQDDDFTNGD